MSSESKLIGDLQKVGFSEDEAHVYLACLKNPKTTPSELATIVRKKRTSLYPILQKLLEMHVIYKKTLTKKKYIFAYPPDRAMGAVRTQTQEEAARIAKVANRLAKQLGSFTEHSSRTSATGAVFLSGTAGTRELVQHVLDEQQDIYWLGPSNIFLDLNEAQQRELFQRLSIKRMDEGTTAYAMTGAEFRKSFYFAGGSQKFRQLKTLDLPESLGAMVVVTGDLCGFVKSFSRASEAVLFRDRAYADVLRFSLRTLWECIRT